MDGFDEVVKKLLVESYDSLDQLDRDFVALEDSPTDRDRLASIAERKPKMESPKQACPGGTG